jgi:cytochrome bd-type quinol oxidase subunit 2
MGRLIAAIIVGYIVMFVFVFVTFSAAYLAMGTDGAFQPGSYEVSGLWIALSIGLGIVASIVAGVVASAMARSAKGPRALAVVVLVLGLAMAIPSLSKNADENRPEVRTGEVGNMEAMQYARQPTWMVFLNPFLGAAGVLIGGALRKQR